MVEHKNLHQELAERLLEWFVAADPPHLEAGRICCSKLTGGGEMAKRARLHLGRRWRTPAR